MKKIINPFDYATEICTPLPGGVLLTTQAEGRVDTMTIGWANIGRTWNKPTVVVYVRTGRFTHSLLEKNSEFTVNVPLGSYDKTILGKAGTTTGRKVDKIKEFGLTLEKPQVISVPGIKEFPLTLECKVIYKSNIKIADVHCDTVPDLYPPEISNPDVARNNEEHTLYVGEIVSAYIIE